MRRLAALCLLAALPACARVKPWQREQLARPSMQAQLGATGMDDEYRAKVVESKTGGGSRGTPSHDPTQLAARSA